MKTLEEEEAGTVAAETQHCRSLRRWLGVRLLGSMEALEADCMNNKHAVAL